MTFSRSCQLMRLLLDSLPAAWCPSFTVLCQRGLVCAMLVVMQQQAPQAQTSAQIVEVPPAKFAGTAVDVPAKITPLMVRQVTQLQTVLKTRESPAGAVHERMHVQSARRASAPMLRSTSAFRSVCTKQIVDVPVPSKNPRERRARESRFSRLWWCNDRFLSFKLW